MTADHNFGDTANPVNKIFLDGVLEGAGEAPFAVVTHGGSASVYLTDLQDTDRPLTDDEQATLKEMRARALETDGVTEALYRVPNPQDGGATNSLDAVHPDWHLGGTARVGELLIVADEEHSLFPNMQDDDALITGHHGHPTDRHIPFVVMSGGTYVRDQTVAPQDAGSVDQGDDTAELPGQAENVDIAPTIGWLLGTGAPAQSQGRILEEAFEKHPLDAHQEGDITEPIANRAAIFIFDQNNSVTLRLPHRS